MLAKTSSKVGRIGQNAPLGIAMLMGLVPRVLSASMSLSWSASPSEETGDSCGLWSGVKFQEDGVGMVFFASMAYKERFATFVAPFFFARGPPLLPLKPRRFTLSRSKPSSFQWDRPHQRCPYSSPLIPSLSSSTSGIQGNATEVPPRFNRRNRYRPLEEGRGIQF